MIGVSHILALGVITPVRVSNGSGGLSGSIEIENFVYDGVNNNFNLSNPAANVIDVYIDQGTYPLQIPEGAVNSVQINSNLLFPGVNVTIKYIRS